MLTHHYYTIVQLVLHYRKVSTFQIFHNCRIHPETSADSHENLIEDSARCSDRAMRSPLPVTKQFRQALTVLLAHRTDNETACSRFQWTRSGYSVADFAECVLLAHRYQSVANRTFGWVGEDQRSWKWGLRLLLKASMPSFWSSKAKSAWNVRRSNSKPWDNTVSKVVLTASLAAMTTGRDFEAMV